MRFIHDKIGRSECPYVWRWIADFGPFSVRLHRWLGDDDRRHHHDHPWWYISLVLWDSYLDVSYDWKSVLLAMALSLV